MFSQSLTGNFKNVKVLPVAYASNGDLAMFLVPMSDGKTFTLSGRRVTCGTEFAMEMAAREDFGIMFGQHWSIMRNKWTDRNGRSQEDIVIIMLLMPDAARLTSEVPLAQLQYLNTPCVDLSSVAERVLSKPDDILKHVNGIKMHFAKRRNVVPHIAGV